MEQDFVELRERSLNCLWAVQELIKTADRDWPPTRRHSDNDPWQARNLRRDFEARKLWLWRAFQTCDTDARDWRYIGKPKLLEPIREVVAGRPVVVGRDVYATAHEAAHEVCVGMYDIKAEAECAADADAENYDFAFVDAALPLLRALPPVQAIEAGIHHEYQLVAKALRDANRPTVGQKVSNSVQTKSEVTDTDRLILNAVRDLAGDGRAKKDRVAKKLGYTNPDSLNNPMSRLVKAGYLHSHGGSRGGYKLTGKDY